MMFTLIPHTHLPLRVLSIKFTPIPSLCTFSLEAALASPTITPETVTALLNLGMEGLVWVWVWDWEWVRVWDWDWDWVRLGLSAVL